MWVSRVLSTSKRSSSIRRVVYCNLTLDGLVVISIYMRRLANCVTLLNTYLTARSHFGEPESSERRAA